jgi:putative peptidoglycan lipid II flippase
MNSSIQTATARQAAPEATTSARRPSRRRLLLSFITVFVARGLGLVLGLAVAVLLANRLGASASTDAFFFARRLTSGASDAIRKVIAVGYIPVVVADIRQRGQRSAVLLWRRRFARLLLVALAVAIAVALGAPLLVALIAPGFAPAAADQAAFLLGLLAFTIPISLALAALATFLLASRRFGLPEAMSELPRVLTVAALLLLIPPFGVTVLAIALLLGAGLAASALATILWRQVRHAPATEEPAGDAEARRPAGRVLPAALMHAYSQASLWMAFGFASTLGAGGVSVFEYGIRLTGLLPSVLGTSFASVAYTELAHRSGEAGAQLQVSVMRSLRAATFIVLPVVTFVAVAAEVLVDLVLKHGVFDETSALNTITVIRFYSPGVAAAAMTSILLIGLYADPKAPHLRIALGAAATGLLLRAGAMMLAIDAFGLVGLPLAASFADAAVLALVGTLVARHWRQFFGKRDLVVLASIGLATAAAGSTAYVMLQILASAGSIWLQIQALAAAGFAAVVVYLLAAVLLRIPEFQIVRSQLPFGLGKKAHAAQS